jgi:hypothetical protein
MQRVPDLELINAIRHASSDMEALRILKEHYPTTHKSIEEIERIVEKFDLACSEKISEDQDGTITTRRGLPNHILDKFRTTLTTYGNARELAGRQATLDECVKIAEGMEIPHTDNGTFVREGGYNQALTDLITAITSNKE